MKAEIISIGDELLIGQIINTNSSWIATQLNLIGIMVNRVTAIGDSKQQILSSIDEAMHRSQIVLITGGLGPTSDDITKPALCEYFNTTLVFDAKVFSQIEIFLKIHGGSMNELNRSQALVPQNATVIQNYFGTAPGLWFRKNDTNFISMPGVPFEMEAMMLNNIIPEIKNLFKLPVIYHKTILTTGIPESKLALNIKNWENFLPKDIKLAYLPSPGIVRLRLSGFGTSLIKDRIEEEILKLKEILGDAIYGYDDDKLENEIGKLLTSINKTLSTAESCTGGNIARLITSVSGSSEYFLGGIIAYSNKIKIRNLGVDKEIIKEHGAISKDVVESMAKGAIKVLNSDYAIAVTGIAGPTGGTKEKPIGTTWIAVASNDNIISGKFSFGDNRERNIIRASIAALNMLRTFIIN